MNIFLRVLFALLHTLHTTHVNGSAISGRIISGIPARQGQFPWQVLIKKDEYDTLWCGGSIISQSWVLTAAHCTDGFESLLLVFGSIDRDNNTNSITSSQFYIHPEYSFVNLANDISLIKLPTPIIFNENIRPIALVTSSQGSNGFVGSTAIIAGFGLTDDEYLESSKNLLWADVQIIRNDDCVIVYDGGVIQDTNICSRGDGNPNKSICSGDSGGPLIFVDSNTTIQIGISSFIAEDRCTEGFPSVFVRVTPYLEYIKNVTGLTFNKKK